jgi:phosphoribosylamine-glycine ligase
VRSVEREKRKQLEREKRWMKEMEERVRVKKVEFRKNPPNN